MSDKRVKEILAKTGYTTEVEKTIVYMYIEELEQENKQLKENNMSMQEEMARTWKKADLYKEVIEEVRTEINYMIGNVDISEIHGIKLLQILDKAKKGE